MLVIRAVLLSLVLAFLWGESGQAWAAKSEGGETASTAKADKGQEAIHQIGIMAEILEMRLKEALGSDLVSDDVFQPGGVRGYRIPDLGVIFLAHVKFSLAEGKPSTATEPTKPAEETLWDRLERASHGAGDTLDFIKVTKGDRQKIATLQKVVAQSLAEYGNRLTTVEPDDKIIVLVGSGTVSDASIELQQSLAYVTRSQQAPDQTILVQTPSDVPATAWILNITKSELTADPDELQKRAMIRITRTTSKEDAKVVRDMTIMSRILEIDLGSELHDEIVSGNMIRRGVEGFYVPGAGAFFFVETKFPLAETPADESPKQKESEDLWDKLERGLEHRAVRLDPSTEVGTALEQLRQAEITAAPDRAPSPTPSKSAGSAVTPVSPAQVNISVNQVAEFTAEPSPPVDKAKIERLKSAIFKVIARYGKRLGELADDERIVVVASRRGGQAPSDYLTLYHGGSKASRGLMLGLDQPRTTYLRSYPVETPSLTVERRVSPGSVLIISVAKKDFADDPGDVAKRARIESYAGVFLGSASGTAATEAILLRSQMVEDLQEALPVVLEDTNKPVSP
jgi:hypothetical protein